MLLLDQAQLNTDIGIIQLLHGRLGDHFARSMAYHTGNFWHIDSLNRKNQAVGNYINILYAYDIKGDSTVNAVYNILTENDIQSIIDFCYRLLEPYNTI